MNLKAKAGRHGGPHRALRVLIVEDSEFDAQLLLHALKRGGFSPKAQIVQTFETMEAALERTSWDLILADHAMPEFSAPAALELVKKRGLDLPFIIVSGQIEEETAVSAMKAGAHDYVMKGRLARLVPAVERELREAEVRCAQKKSEEALRRSQEELEIRVEKRTADLRAANLQLHRMLEERRRLENELLEIAEKERQRIGFDLHDDLGQKLTGLLLMLKGLHQRLDRDQHPCAAEAEKVLLLIEQIMHHTHDLARQFTSLDVQGDHLPSVLRGLAENVKKMFSLPCDFNVRGVIPSLPEHATIQLYKIAQEAVSNAIKHGKAKRVAIHLKRNRDRLVMTVTNDGASFDPATQTKNRMGLRIMNFRANTIGASLDIEPNDGSGTIVTCALPIKMEPRPLGERSPNP